MSEAVQYESPRRETDFGELIQLYLETRDSKAVLEQKQKKHLKRYTDVLVMIEAKLLAHIQEHGVQALSSDLGTAYLSTSRSSPITDAVAFKNYVIENRAWDMLDWKANITAVSEFLVEHNILPPGVAYRTNTKLNVMRK